MYSLFRFFILVFWFFFFFFFKKIFFFSLSLETGLILASFLLWVWSLCLGSVDCGPITFMLMVSVMGMAPTLRTHLPIRKHFLRFKLHDMNFSPYLKISWSQDTAAPMRTYKVQTNLKLSPEPCPMSYYKKAHTPSKISAKYDDHLHKYVVRDIPLSRNRDSNGNAT